MNPIETRIFAAIQSAAPGAVSIPVICQDANIDDPREAISWAAKLVTTGAVKRLGDSNVFTLPGTDHDTVCETIANYPAGVTMAIVWRDSGLKLDRVFLALCELECLDVITCSEGDYDDATYAIPGATAPNSDPTVRRVRVMGDTSRK